MILATATAMHVDSASAGPAPCADVTRALGVSRKIAIDTSVGRLFGSMTSLSREPSFLHAREVVLTFDDGPMPWVTRSILNTLDQYCTKATFFSVGRMALAYPDVVREVVERGHTLGSHTYSHPFRLPRLGLRVAKDEIDRGVAAVSAAAQIDIAPFFRFPGLAASENLVNYAASQGLASFTVDVVSNDSYISDPEELAVRTLSEIEKRGRGIVLFHDIKTTTAKALPAILSGLAIRGYRVVHMVARTPARPRPELMGEFTSKLAKAEGTAKSVARAVPFYGTTGPLKTTASRPVPRDSILANKPPAHEGKDMRPTGPASPEAKAAVNTLPAPRKSPPPSLVNLSPKPKDAPTPRSAAKTISVIRDDHFDINAPNGTAAPSLSGPPIVGEDASAAASEPVLPPVEVIRNTEESSSWEIDVQKETSPTRGAGSVGSR